MLLVVGGAASGKHAYVSSLGYTEEQICHGGIGPQPVALDIHELVDKRLSNMEQEHTDATIKELIEGISEELFGKLAAKEVVTCDEMGCGVIPLAPHDRRTREATGRLCLNLARRAHRVIRMQSGIPQLLKDDSQLITITLLRHAKTYANRSHRYSGRGSDDAVSPEGAEAARALGSDPWVGTVYVTPLARTAQTAELLYPNARPVVVDSFAEMDFGIFEGRNANEMHDDPAYRAWVDSMCNGPCPEGEDRASFARRTCSAFTALVHEATRQGTREIAIVAHGGTLMSVLGAWGEPRRPYWEWITDNCCGYRFTVDPLTWDANPRIENPQPMRGPHPASSTEPSNFAGVAKQEER